MKRTLIYSLASALLSAVLATTWSDDSSQWQLAPEAAAQPQLGRADVVLPRESLPQSGAPSATTTATALTPEEQTNVRVYEIANRSVVNINTRTVSYDRFFMLSSHDEGAGSGSVLDKRGHILTNNHVIEDAEQIMVTLSGGKEYPAELVGRDISSDIAVLKIDAPASDLFPITVGTSENLRVGQRVYTLGNPFGFDGTMTTGIISNLNRTLPSRQRGREMKSIIQTDAAMNPGNSGGPLLDTAGRMIGMNVAIASTSGQNSGLGFAIPANRIRQIVPQLIQQGKVTRADIGIVAVNEIDEGLQIVRTNKGGPADRAGLRGWGITTRQVRRGFVTANVPQDDKSQADVIIAVDGTKTTTASDFIETIEQHRPGDKVVLTVLREGQQVKVEVTLGAA
jgi:S1-C subfamily serine protease